MILPNIQIQDINAWVYHLCLVFVCLEVHACLVFVCLGVSFVLYLYVWEYHLCLVFVCLKYHLCLVFIYLGYHLCLVFVCLGVNIDDTPKHTNTRQMILPNIQIQDIHDTPNIQIQDINDTPKNTNTRYK
jgi:hypothetical protein